MRCEKVARLSGLTLLVGSIVVSAGSSVNRNTTTNSTTQIEVADGMPLPPLPPGKADGMPLPPLPPSKTDAVIAADGLPLQTLPPSRVDVLGQDRLT
jgi:hypothetical protein